MWEAHKTHLRVGDKPCCTVFWKAAFHNCSNNMLYKTPSGSSQIERADVRLSVLTWFNILKDSLDYLPNEHVYQASAPRKRTMYNWYLADNARTPDIFKFSSKSYFMKVWREDCADIKLRKNLRFTKCSFCELQREIRDDVRKHLALRQAAAVELFEHYQYVHAERSYEKMKEAKSCLKPLDFLHITMDATDQLPFGIPHFPQIIKSDKKSRMKTKLMIVVAHGVGVWTYLGPPNVAEDSNWNIECLQRTLKSVEQRKGYLPPVLSLQFDNCQGQNKNTPVFCYLTWLVERGAFTEIYTSFLPVGHTHNIADQVGSRFSHACKEVLIYSHEGMMKILRVAYTPNPTCVVTHVSPRCCMCVCIFFLCLLSRAMFNSPYDCTVV